MADVYEIGDDASTTRMKRVHCKDEAAELQALLKHNPDLLPGDQIRSDEPRRWLLLRREMPVPDPSTGSSST